jgi:hypothetical protein
MQRITLQKPSLTPTFIGSWILEQPSLCDDLITYFEVHIAKQRTGVTGGGRDLDKKDSTDITIQPKDIKLPGNEVFEKYLHNLFSCYQEYVIEWPFLEGIGKKLEIGSFNLQRYKSGQHFQNVHAERTSLNSLHRIFAWMTYLNDVDIKDGGSTFFSHYGLEIQPRKGLTLIWPAEWTHAHRGNVILGESKYIITGWMHFPNNPNSL